MADTKVVMSKVEMKAKVKVLRKSRDEAVTAKKADQATILRRKIHTLKHKIRNAA